MKPLLLKFILICSFWSCVPDYKEKQMPESRCKILRYAKGFTIDTSGTEIDLTVREPWAPDSNRLCHYHLTTDVRKVKPGVLSVPLKKVILLSTSYISMIEALGNIHTISGISGHELVNSTVLQQRIKKGLVKNIGNEPYLNYEEIIHLCPDAVIAYGIQGENRMHIDKLEQLGIPVLLVSEYLEPHPLGKAEWLFFFACLYNCVEAARQIFDSIEVSYLRTAAKTKSLQHRPAIITGLPWRGLWWVPGGQSYFAALISDAGGHYLWADNTSSASISVSFEKVLSHAQKADIWINCGNAMSLDDIKKTDSRLVNFKPWQTGQVYNNNARMNINGGNDFWESGILYPDRILADLSAIFHPEVCPEHSLIYYRKLTPNNK